MHIMVIYIYIHKTSFIYIDMCVFICIIYIYIHGIIELLYVLKSLYALFYLSNAFISCFCVQIYVSSR